MCSDLDPDPYLKGQGHTIQVLQIKDSISFFFIQNNLDIDLTYTRHNLNNFNKHPSITCSYIQKYLGYLSNNLYFLFSHSWQVVVYNFGQIQRTSQVERKTKCSKKQWQDWQLMCFYAEDQTSFAPVTSFSSLFVWICYLTVIV